MTVTLEEMLERLSPEDREAVEARAAELMAEEMTLDELRKARRLTQARMAELLGTGQAGVSRLERRSDLLLSTLRGYVEAMGGSLELVARFPDKRDVVISGFEDIGGDEAEPEEARPRAAGKR